MCKFCEMSKMDDFILLDDKELNLGVLGKMYGTLKFINEEGGLKAIGYDLYLDTNGDTFYQKIVEIKYCPFCGKNLESN